MRTVLNQREIARLNQHPQVVEDTEVAADGVVSEAQRRAPKDTGAGAASIHREPDGEGGQRVGWDEAHDYMRFHELGTEMMPATPFLRPAAK
jgi:HK97 gp10 family phage protein